MPAWTFALCTGCTAIFRRSKDKLYSWARRYARCKGTYDKIKARTSIDGCVDVLGARERVRHSNDKYKRARRCAGCKGTFDKSKPGQVLMGV